MQDLTWLNKIIADKDDRNGDLHYDISRADYNNQLAAHVKLDQANTKLDQANTKLDEANAKLDEANAKLDAANAKLDEALVKLDRTIDLLNDILCPFKKNGVDFTVLGQGCDGEDQDCNQKVDECDEDKVPPTITLTQKPPEIFKSIEEATMFLEEYLDASDDCAAVLDVSIEPPADPACCECTFRVTVADRRCSLEGTEASTVTETFILNVAARNPPIVTCGFFSPQDPNHVSAEFDPCAGVSPPFPPQFDPLHIDQNCFEETLIDVNFWYQIGVSIRPKKSSARALPMFVAQGLTRSAVPLFPSDC
jgi:exonuclease VII small subunit